jgi:hypothetical protein
VSAAWAGWVFPVFAGAVSLVGGPRAGVVLLGVAAWAGAGMVAWHGIGSGAEFVSVRGSVSGPGGVVMHARGGYLTEGGGRAVYSLGRGVRLVQGWILVGLPAAVPGACMGHSC